MLAMDEKRLRWCGMDMRPRWSRRVGVVVTLGVYFVATFWAVNLRAHHAGFWVMLGVQVWLLMFSVFRDGRVVKSFEVTPETGAASRMIVSSLDDWAQYRFGVATFEECTVEQKEELLVKYRVGRWVVPRNGGSRYGEPDEREARERDAAVRRTMNWLAICLGGLGGQLMWGRHPVDGMVAGMWLLVIAAMTQVGPKVIVLWEEPDPRADGELWLVEG